MSVPSSEHYANPEKELLEAGTAAGRLFRARILLGLDKEAVAALPAPKALKEVRDALLDGSRHTRAIHHFGMVDVAELMLTVGGTRLENDERMRFAEYLTRTAQGDYYDNIPLGSDRARLAAVVTGHVVNPAFSTLGEMERDQIAYDARFTPLPPSGPATAYKETINPYLDKL
jgi:hypothetical protein